jgi:undecaprenyl-diphosphatase
VELSQALILGLVQGITEFVPISSSAHLVILPWLFGWEDPGLTFDVSLHLGTLLAVLAYFWRDWQEIGGGFIRGLARRAPFDEGARLGWFLLVGTIPGGLAGALLEHQAETVFRDLRLVASMLVVLGAVLLLAEYLQRHRKGLAQLTLLDCLLVGIAQASAIVPGVSRSGATITMGLLRGLQREAAARFSFLLATPIILGASAKRLSSLAQGGLPPDERLPFLLGTAAAALAGFATIALLLRYLQRHSTLPFVLYRFAAGLGILAVLFWRGV